MTLDEFRAADKGIVIDKDTPGFLELPVHASHYELSEGLGAELHCRHDCVSNAMTCRCDCVSCNSGGHAECYYNRPDGSAECGLIELVATAIHAAHFHPDDAGHPRVKELYRESRGQMLKQARVAVRAMEDHAREENRRMRDRFPEIA